MSAQWLSLVATIWLQSVSGTSTNFPAYSSQLKRLLNISQVELNNLAFASDAGKILAWFSGVAAAHLPLWLVLLIGSLIGMIAGNSICWINTVCYVLTIQSFPLDMQLALGLSTSYQGLSAKIYADVIDVVYANSSSADKARGYLLVNSALPFLVCIIVAPLVARSSNVDDPRSPRGGSPFSCSRKLSSGFIVMFLITIVTGTYAVITSSLGVSTSSGRSSQLFILTGIVLLVVVCPLLVPLVEKIRETVQHKCWIRQHKVCSVLTDESVNEAPTNLENGEVKKEGEISQGAEEEQIGPKLMLKKVDFWLYFFVYLFGATLGLVFLNNLGQVVESRGQSRTSTLVSLSSSFSFFGRLLPSLLDYFLARTKYMSSRAGAMAMMMAPMSGAFFMLLINNNISLYISTAIISVSTGAISTISVSTTRELFGAKDFGINHNILIINIPVGSFIFGNSAAVLYRRNSYGGKCMGMTCYQTSFMIWGSLCCLGSLLALILHSRTKKLHSCNN
ncbi:hypothetical protein DCAR_0728682 [Daucus carota subsp. sativus]|uniref:Nodulin-like domain-containing protein n=1 Tax=Daucus carota subsp. sativus TaxID=79200 RepID=A0AAF0XMJ0_DAUCS|nr:hypothetical protein DCAR_0728682 [Daucus carota subsp. sativus]